MSSKTHQDIFAKDIEWRDGSAEGIKYTRFPLDVDKSDTPVVIMTKFAPGAVVAPHTHDCSYFEYVIDGEQTVGKVTFGPGDIRIVKGGFGYGPIAMGKDGCTVLIVFEDASRSTWEALPRKKKSLNELA